MAPRILAFRSATVVERLGPRSQACPLSPRVLLGAAAELGLLLPLLQAPVAAVARAALVAAKELQSVLGLALPPGVPPEPWFEAVTQAADEVAAGLPLFLCGEVVVAGEGATQVERAFHEAWRMADAGLTHLAIDVAAVASGERGRVAGEIAQAALERGVGVDVVLPLAEGAQGIRGAAALFEELALRGEAADVASVRCPAPADRDEARVQVAALVRLCQALRGIPVVRRGPVTPELLALLRGSPVKGCEDGGAAAARALGLLPFEVLPPSDEGEESRARASPLEQAVAELTPEAADRLEARANVDALEFLERLGTSGSARAVARALERRMEDRG